MHVSMSENMNTCVLKPVHGHMNQTLVANPSVLQRVRIHNREKRVSGLRSPCPTARSLSQEISFSKKEWLFLVSLRD